MVVREEQVAGRVQGESEGAVEQGRPCGAAIAQKAAEHRADYIGGRPSGDCGDDTAAIDLPDPEVAAVGDIKGAGTVNGNIKRRVEPRLNCRPANPR